MTKKASAFSWIDWVDTNVAAHAARLDAVEKRATALEGDDTTTKGTLTSWDATFKKNDLLNRVIALETALNMAMEALKKAKLVK